MILNQAQAKAIANAISELNNIGATALEIDAKDFVVKCPGNSVVVRGGDNEREFYLNQSNFFEAYGLN
jgi:hypothetical protein